MPEKAGAAAELIFTPCGRAFFVYYVAMALGFLGPRINPDVGLPVWLGTVLGLIVVAAVIYMKWGQEYRITSQGMGRALPGSGASGPAAAAPGPSAGSIKAASALSLP